MSTSPSPQEATRLALVAGPAGAQGIYVAGVAITMAPGSHTYWKVPGDAGVPPVFDFAGSQNVRSAQVRYPAPRRIAEEGLEAYGYFDDVTFPVDVVAADPAKPAVLKAEIAYAVCNKICLPAKASASVTLAPGIAGADASGISAALAEVPQPATAPERAALVVVPEVGAAKPAWTLTWRGATPVDDIFADAPDGAFFSTRKTGPATWRLVLDEAGRAPPDRKGTPVALTLARTVHPLLVEERLDTVAATR